MINDCIIVVDFFVCKDKIWSYEGRGYVRDKQTIAKVLLWKGG